MSDVVQSPLPPRDNPPALDRRDWVAALVTFSLVALGWLLAPALPTSLEDWPALRPEMFFRELAVQFPAAAGDGPLALLLQPVFGTGHALGQVIWELSAAIFVALIAALALHRTSLVRRSVCLLTLLSLGLLWREAGYWFATVGAFALLTPADRAPSAFLAGVALGLLGLLAFPFFLCGLLGLPVLALTDRSWTNAVRALAGWTITGLTGWTIAAGSPTDFLNFVVDGSFAYTAGSPWVLLTATAVLLLAILAAWRFPHRTLLLLVLAAALPNLTRPAGCQLDRLDSIPARYATAWSILAHPVKFEKRVLTPAWHRLREGQALPEIQAEIQAGFIDVLGAPQLIALTNGLKHRPRSRFTTARAVLAPSNLEVSRELPPHQFLRLREENGFTLYLRGPTETAGFSAWRHWLETRPLYPPARIESPHPPQGTSNEGQTAHQYQLPLRLTYGPLPFACQSAEGRFRWEGGSGRFRVLLRRTDGSVHTLMERGLNPAQFADQHGEQHFAVDLPDLPDAWLELEATADAPADTSPRFVHQGLLFKRDVNRMISTDVSPDRMHSLGGYGIFPAIIFSLTEASPMKEADGSTQMMVHMPAALAFAKPREGTRLTGTFGFLPGAYEKANEGTAGAIFNIVWLSGTDRAEQIFSRTLRPRTEPADRGPQTFDLDVSGLPDGLLHFSINPAVPGNNSFGWTYLGNLDLQTPDRRSADERYQELFDAYIVNFRPVPGLLKTNEQRPQIITASGRKLLRLHAPGEAILPVTAGRTEAVGRFGFADEAWQSRDLTDGAEFVVLWRDHAGDKELFRRRLEPHLKPADRGVHEFSVNLADRGSGLLVLRTEPGPSGNNYWDWTGWSDVSVR